MTILSGAIWGIAGLSTAGVIVRPMGLPEWIWAVAGAVLLVVLGLIPVGMAGAAVMKGLDVYLFLLGMMLLSETARMHGVFDWLAGWSVVHARGSAARLFTLIYIAGVVVTIFLSNDATAVVLTPAVFAVARKAKVDPLPMLLTCAMVANAASFVLPISNPANLVLYGGHTPPLGAWLRSFALPSIGAIAVTYLALRFMMSTRLTCGCAAAEERVVLDAGGRVALGGILGTALLLLIVSALDTPLGLPTAIAGAVTALGVSALRRRSPWPLWTGVAWGVLPLVAGLFVLVEALDRIGAFALVVSALERAAREPLSGGLVSGTILAFGSNLINNLPAGLIASTSIARAHPPQAIVDALLIGVDLGPNLSVTGSLATILWLQVIHREGEHIGFWQFAKVGAGAMPLALAFSLLSRLMSI
ncbi:MAG TPA: arsenic transporter [Sphingobium sp.]|uniref:arsenic transporter n=1 Tax=Sphingobium sp. TaxID=1912891 RepID=UPI002ED2E5F0